MESLSRELDRDTREDWQLARRERCRGKELPAVRPGSGGRQDLRPDGNRPLQSHLGPSSWSLFQDSNMFSPPHKSSQPHPGRMPNSPPDCQVPSIHRSHESATLNTRRQLLEPLACSRPTVSASHAARGSGHIEAFSQSRPASPSHPQSDSQRLPCHVSGRVHASAQKQEAAQNDCETLTLLPGFPHSGPQPFCRRVVSDVESTLGVESLERVRGEKNSGRRRAGDSTAPSGNSCACVCGAKAKDRTSSPGGNGKPFTWAQRVSRVSHDAQKAVQTVNLPTFRREAEEQEAQKDRHATKRGETGEGGTKDRKAETDTGKGGVMTRRSKEFIAENKQETAETRVAPSSNPRSSGPVSSPGPSSSGWSRGPSTAVYTPPQRGTQGGAAQESEPNRISVPSAVVSSCRETGTSARGESKAKELGVSTLYSRAGCDFPMHATYTEPVSPFAASSETGRARQRPQGESKPASPARVERGDGRLSREGEEQTRQETQTEEEKEQRGVAKNEGGREHEEEVAHMTPPDTLCVLSAIQGLLQTSQGERLSRFFDEDTQEFPELSLKLTGGDLPSFAQRGLVNTHNNCYMNAVVQALLPVLLPLWPRLLSPLYRARKIGQGSDSQPHSAASLSLWGSLAEAVRVFLEFKKSSSVARPGDVARIFQHVVSGHSRGGMAEAGLVWGQQADASEFLLFLINGLHDECKWTRGHADGFADSSGAQNGDDGFVEIGKKNKKIRPRAIGSDEDSLVYRLFGGSLRECSVDPRTGSKLSERKEFFLFVSCSVLPHLRTLEAVLDAHFADQEVELAEAGPKASGADERTLGAKRRGTGGTGEGRKRGAEAERRSRRRLQTRIESPPPILVIVLQRFSYDREKQRARKVSHPVTLSERLVLRPSWCVSSSREGLQKLEGVSAAGTKNPKSSTRGCAFPLEAETAKRERHEQTCQLGVEERTYELSGVISHKGVLMNRGHYTAASRLPVSLAATAGRRQGGACREYNRKDILSSNVTGGSWVTAAKGGLRGEALKREAQADVERPRGGEEQSESQTEKERRAIAQEQPEDEETVWILSDDMSCSVRSFDAVQNMEGHYVLIFVNRRWQVSTDPRRAFERARMFQAQQKMATKTGDED